MLFTKPATTFQDQINQLKFRGLTIADEAFAEHWLKQISYYRLSGYWWPLQSDKVNHFFKANSKFETVIHLYNFDSELRTLLFDVIEHIEIALRCKLIYHLCHEKTPWWFEDSSLFQDRNEHNECITTMDRDLRRHKTKETFLKEHYTKYHMDTRRPPAWKTLEVVSFGTLSKLYGNLKNTVLSKDHISVEFGTANHIYLPSWLQAIAQIRNICAHHGRLWNKNLPGRPKLLPKPPDRWLQTVPPASEHHMLYIHMCCMKYLSNRIHAGNNFTYRLYSLLKKYPNIDIRALGMNRKWLSEPLWNNKIDTALTKASVFYHKGIYLLKNLRKGK